MPSDGSTEAITHDLIDRDQPCSCCGRLAARELADGAIECVRCGHVRADPFVVAKRSLRRGGDA